MKTIIYIAMTTALLLAASAAGSSIPGSRAGSTTDAPFTQIADDSGATIEQGPPIDCLPNETKETQATLYCGRNDAGAPNEGEFHCHTFYDSATGSCQRKCDWTGACSD